MNDNKFAFPFLGKSSNTAANFYAMGPSIGSNLVDIPLDPSWIVKTFQRSERY
jgi:hypothetical protein